MSTLPPPLCIPLFLFLILYFVSLLISRLQGTYFFPYSVKRSGVGVCLALRTLVREVKRTLAIVGSWIGPLSIKYGLDSRAPQQK